MSVEPSDLFRLLLAHKVRFIVVGGLACAMYHHVRVTDDADILVATDPANVTALLAALATWGDGYARDLTAEMFTLEPGAIRLHEEYPLDIFTLMDGKPYETFIDRAPRTPDGLAYLHISDLIAAKQHSVRENDQRDVTALRLIQARQAQ